MASTVLDLDAMERGPDPDLLGGYALGKISFNKIKFLRVTKSITGTGTKRYQYGNYIFIFTIKKLHKTAVAAYRYWHW